MKVLAIMFLCHFVADFLLQSRDMGKNKSEQFSVLLAHLNIQYFIMWVGLIFFIGPEFALKIAASNALVHGLIDWYIWRGYKWSVFYRIKKGIDKHLYSRIEMKEGPKEDWKYYEDHWFYSAIGFDQLLHGLTLIALVGLFL